jgi:hypothetical protein
VKRVEKICEHIQSRELGFSVRVISAKVQAMC